MADIVAMPGRGPRDDRLGAVPVAAIITRLEELLALARAGEIRAIAYAMVDPRNCTFDGWTSGENEPTGHALIAAVTFLQHNIVSEKNSTASVPPPVLPPEPA